MLLLPLVLLLLARPWPLPLCRVVLHALLLLMSWRHVSTTLALANAAAM